MWFPYIENYNLIKLYYIYILLFYSIYKIIQKFYDLIVDYIL